MLQKTAITLRTLIKEKGLKQYIVAKRAGFTAKEFSDLLYGRKVFKADYVERVCNALEITPNMLYGVGDAAQAHDETN